MARESSELPSNLCTGWNRRPGGLFTTSTSSSSWITSSGVGSATRGTALDARRSVDRTRSGDTPSASATSSRVRPSRKLSRLASSSSLASCAFTASTAAATSRHCSFATADTASGAHLRRCSRN